MDIWVAIHPANAKKIVEILKKFGFAEQDLSADLFLEKNQIIRMGVPPIRIEILTSISGVEFGDCYNSRITDTIDGIEINLINLENLKKNKQAAGRHKDLNDLECL